MEVLKNKDINKVVSIDIETVRYKDNYEDLSDDTKRAWRYKTKHEGQELNLKDLKSEWRNRASLYAEFSKACAVSLVFLNKEQITAKEFYDEDEETLLHNLDTFLSRIYNNGFVLVGHAAKYFDYPYLSKRYIINGMSVPKILDTSNKKPWEHSNICTNELWKSFGTGPGSSLIALCNVLNIPISKVDLTGDQVGVSYFKGEIERISNYCTLDALATFNVFLKLKGSNIYQAEDLKKIDKDEKLSVLDYVRANHSIDKKAKEKVKSLIKDKTDEEKQGIKKLFLSAVGKDKKERDKIENLIK